MVSLGRRRATALRSTGASRRLGRAPAGTAGAVGPRNVGRTRWGGVTPLVGRRRRSSRLHVAATERHCTRRRRRRGRRLPPLRCRRRHAARRKAGAGEAPRSGGPLEGTDVALWRHAYLTGNGEALPRVAHAAVVGHRRRLAPLLLLLLLPGSGGGGGGEGPGGGGRVRGARVGSTRVGGLAAAPARGRSHIVRRLALRQMARRRCGPNARDGPARRQAARVRRPPYR